MSEQQQYINKYSYMMSEKEQQEKIFNISKEQQLSLANDLAKLCLDRTEFPKKFYKLSKNHQEDIYEQLKLSLRFAFDQIISFNDELSKRILMALYDKKLSLQLLSSKNLVKEDIEKAKIQLNLSNQYLDQIANNIAKNARHSNIKKEIDTYFKQERKEEKKNKEKELYDNKFRKLYREEQKAIDEDKKICTWKDGYYALNDELSRLTEKSQEEKQTMEQLLKENNNCEKKYYKLKNGVGKLYNSTMQRYQDRYMQDHKLSNITPLRLILGATFCCILRPFCKCFRNSNKKKTLEDVKKKIDLDKID